MTVLSETKMKESGNAYRDVAIIVAVNVLIRFSDAKLFGCAVS